MHPLSDYCSGKGFVFTGLARQGICAARDFSNVSAKLILSCDFGCIFKKNNKNVIESHQNAYKSVMDGIQKVPEVFASGTFYWICAAGDFS